MNNDSAPQTTPPSSSGQMQGVITGYRNLSPEEISMMNKIKEAGKSLEALVAEVETFTQANLQAGASVANNPVRWVALGRTSLQVGLMELARAIAKPTSF